MADEPEEEEQGDMEETERLAAQTDHVVNVTVEIMKVAERVLTDFDKGDAEFEEGEPPSIMEICAVTQMIMSGNMAGVYKMPEKKGKSTVEELFDLVAPLIKSQVSLAVLEATRKRVQAVPYVPPAPVMPEPYVPQKSLFDECVEQIYEDLEKCECFKKNMKHCTDCEKRDVFREVMSVYVDKIMAKRPKP